MNKREICAVMQQVYSERGPRDAAGHTVPPSLYAAMSADEIAGRWDFEDRFLMHRLAKAIIAMQSALGNCDDMGQPIVEGRTPHVQHAKR